MTPALGHRGHGHAPAVAALLVVLFAVKLALAAMVPPFGDEVFYWQESRHLAAAYTDLPPLTAWLVRAGTALLGDGLLGLRFGFVLCGVVTIALLLAWAQSRLASTEGVAGFALAIPLLVLSGQLATPDAPLTLAIVAAAWSLDLALDSGRWRHWLFFALALAFAWLTHWRAAMLYPVGVVLLAISPRAQLAARAPRFWIAQSLALAGLLPTLWFNATHDWVGLRFQAVERHAWQFDGASLLQPFEQAATLGFVLYPLLLWAMWRAWQRRREPGIDVIAALSIGIAASYFLIGLFADAERTRFHWPLPAYLPLLLLLPTLARECADRCCRRWFIAAKALAYATTFAIALLMLSFGFANERWPPGGDRRLGETFLGWDVAALETERQLRELPQDTLLVADNFLLAAQLDFAAAGVRPVYVLDHARNVKHGRQKQLELWQRDAAALRVLPAQDFLLVVEENALYAADTLPFYRALCRDFDLVRYVDERALFGVAKRFVWFSLRRDAEAGGERACRLPPLGHLNFPTEGLRVAPGQGFELSGWAIREPAGIDAFEVRIDGRRDAAASASFGLPATYVRDVWPDLEDARWPIVGFYLRNAGHDLPPGPHRIEVLAQADGIWRLIAVREVIVL